MARGNLLLGKARGKLGSVVFSQNRGAQITRAKAASVANPKTISQNTQRAILATIAKSAAAMTSLVDHSFANVTYGAESVRHFRKINMGLLRQLYLNSQNDANLVAKGGVLVPNPLKISEGSLPAFFASVDSGDIAFYQSSTYLPSEQDITVADFLATYPSLQGGDQLTLVKITKINEEGSLADGDAIFNMSLERIVFAPNAFADLNAVIITEASRTIEPQFLDLTKTTNSEMLSMLDGGAGNGLGFSSEGIVYYAALILSRKVNGKWQRSTQYLKQIEFDDHADNETAIASYGATESASVQNEYLNQADKSTGKKGVSGPYGHFYSQIGDTENDLTSVDVGSSGSQTVTAAANSEILLTCSGYATSDNPIVKATIQNGDELLIMGKSYCEYLFKLTDDTADQYIGRVMLRDGSKAEVAWNVYVQS